MAVQDKPDATVLLLCYNQEAYIEDAVRSVLAQVGSRIQIIISDDCSTDQTLKRARQAIHNYTGPHSVKLNANKENLGLISHINKLVEMADGDIIVMAAGDDISLPHRVRACLDGFHNNTMAVFSAVDIINRSGQYLRTRHTWSLGDEVPLLYLCKKGGVGPGASYAYRKKVFEWPWKYEGNVPEDRIYPLRAGLLGKVRYISTPLVSWREHPTNSSPNSVRHMTQHRVMVEHSVEIMKSIAVACSQGYVSDETFTECTYKLMETAKKSFGSQSKFVALTNFLKKIRRVIRNSLQRSE
jgi:glycosyltransferase involved in cell wall biosynthesis